MECPGGKYILIYILIYLINLPTEHPIMSFKTIEIKMAAVSAKKVYWIYGRHTSQGLGNVFPTEYRLEIDEK